MTLQLENEQERELTFDYEQVAEQVITEVLDMEACPYESEVSLTLTDNTQIQRLNKEFRKMDRPTDVLSFPMVDFQNPADYDLLEADGWEAYFNPESGELLLGDIVISVERATEQAEEFGHSLKREYAFLIAHSMLHLLGYDHMVPEEAKTMEERQEAVLHKLNITREGD
ncbi:MAG TPA: rRNA maturation RNase YbeY [Candidatus Pelethocola excrementipullorum]|nr:rRNA maturation RNase YbeY [Candidatus Pelethocola excrementipullorum]